MPLDVKDGHELPWDQKPWETLSQCTLTHHMGVRPAHFPEVRVKLGYDREAIFLMFRVADRYVLAKASADQDPVFKDSCVEFFFTPGPDLAFGYFNLEINCGGTILFHFQNLPRQDRILVSDPHCRAAQRVASLPKRVWPEIADPVVWTVTLRLPVDVLASYCPVVHPETGVVWRGNFYKCADDSSRPHWLTWAPVASQEPDFHVPASFGILRFG